MGEHMANLPRFQLDEARFTNAGSRVAPAQPWAAEAARRWPGRASLLEPTANESDSLAHGASHSHPSLFPILDAPASNGETPAYSPRPRTGLARMAEDAEAAGDGHLVEFRSLPVRSILNRSVSRRSLRFAHTINPYRGCEFACRYCYARYTHEFLDLNEPEAFERRIFIKQNAAWLLEQELRSFDRSEEIAIGTATDPYQPVERRARVTRSILEVLARRSGLRIGLVTKSTLIERDIELLQALARRNELVLHITITTPDAELARKLEPRAPRPDLRLRTVERLRQAGLRTGVLCSPLLPGLTDTAFAIDRMAALAKAADASFFSAQPLFLKPCSRPVFLDFLREHYPELEPSYLARYDADAFVSKAYASRIRAIVRAATRQYGLGERSSDAILTRDRGYQRPEEAPAQAMLWSAEPVRRAGSRAGGSVSPLAESA